MRYECRKNGVTVNVIMADAQDGADAVCLAAGYDEAIVLTEAEPARAPTRRLSKIGFINLFSDDEYKSILTLAGVSVDALAWLKKFELAAVDADGTSIDLDDPRTVAGIHDICAALVLAGTIAAGGASARAAEILRG